MLFLISLAIACLFTFLCDKSLKKHPVVFYIGAAVITVVVIAVSQQSLQPGFVKDYLVAIFSRGAIAAAFWAVVMWAAAFPNGSAPIKKIMPIRGELSIFAAVLTLSHAVTYSIQYITSIINKRTGSGKNFTVFVITCIVAILLMLIMIPLTIMSFKKIRKKMNGKTWKNIQRTAYVFYALIYIHIMVIFVPRANQGREGYLLSIIVYSAVFIGYAVMRIRKWILLRKKPENKTVLNIVCAVAFAALMAGAVCISLKKESAGSNSSGTSEEAPMTFTFAAPTENISETTTTIVSEETTVTVTTVVSTATGAVTDTGINTQTTDTTDTTGTGTDTVTTTTAISSSEGEETENSEESPENNEESPENNNEENQPEPEQEQPEPEQNQPEPEQNQPEPEQNQPEPEPEPEPTYKYKNGTYEGSGTGYEGGTVTVKITIENDVITGFEVNPGYDDPEYFNPAAQYVIPQIQSRASTDGVDALSESTYSSNGIIEASRNALNSALN